MSALAKIFVLVLFVLSLIFFGTSATLFKTRTDWREAYNRLKKDTDTGLADLRAMTAKQRKAWETLDKNLADARGRGQELQIQVKDLGSNLNQAQSKTALAQQSADKANDAKLLVAEALKAKEVSYDKLSEQLEKAREDREGAIDTARTSNQLRDSMRLDLAKTQEELHVARVEYKDLSEKYETLEVILTSVKKKYGDGVIPGSVAPRIDAVVKAVEDKLVVLSVGQDQKVQEGFEFTVYRGEKFIGKVKVTHVYPDLCGAMVIFTKENVAIHAGDRASTNI